MQQELNEKLMKIFYKMFDLKENEINFEMSLDNIGVDSTEIVELTIIINKEFGTKFAPGNINKNDSIKDIVIKINNQLS